jgi:hypothetical protein
VAFAVRKRRRREREREEEVRDPILKGGQRKNFFSAPVLKIPRQ